MENLIAREHTPQKAIATRQRCTPGPHYVWAPVVARLKCAKCAPPACVHATRAYKLLKGGSYVSWGAYVCRRRLLALRDLAFRKEGRNDSLKTSTRVQTLLPAVYYTRSHELERATKPKVPNASHRNPVARRRRDPPRARYKQAPRRS